MSETMLSKTLCSVSVQGVSISIHTRSIANESCSCAISTTNVLVKNNWRNIQTMNSWIYPKFQVPRFLNNQLCLIVFLHLLLFLLYFVNFSSNSFILFAEHWMIVEHFLQLTSEDAFWSEGIKRQFMII